jgi:hypothetical protein
MFAGREWCFFRMKGMKIADNQLYKLEKKRCN